MKKLVFAALATGLIATVAPAAPQLLGDAGFQFVKAVRESDGATAEELIRSHSTGILNSKSSSGETGLSIALMRRDEQWTGFLLNKGADPNVPGKGGDTPLIVAARTGFTTGVEWLLTAGAKVDATNKMGETPLIVAVQHRQVPIVKLLLAKGADPDRTDTAAGFSARDYARRDGRSRDILQMIEAKKPKSAAAAGR